jgi:hypothetical protein
MRFELSRRGYGKRRRRMSKALNKQVGGSHYKLPIQPVEFIYKNDLDYIRGNVIKYVTRKKNGAEDILKAIHYCEMLLELEYGEEEEIYGSTGS